MGTRTGTSRRGREADREQARQRCAGLRSALALAASAIVIAGSVHLAGSAWAGAPGQAPDTDLPAGARAAVLADLAVVTPMAAPVIQRVTPLVRFDDDVSRCTPPATSCAYPPSDGQGPWRIHLDAETTGFPYPSNRFLVYHELGHAVWGLVLGAAGQKAFADDVRAALHGKRCIDDVGRPCAPITEMFADEFARFAGGFAVSMTYYCTPPLLSRDTLAGLVGAPDEHAKPSPRCLRRPVYDRGRIRWTVIRADAPNVREDRGIRR